MKVHSVSGMGMAAIEYEPNEGKLQYDEFVRRLGAFLHQHFGRRLKSWTKIATDVETRIVHVQLNDK